MWGGVSECVGRKTTLEEWGSGEGGSGSSSHWGIVSIVSLHRQRGTPAEFLALCGFGRQG